MSQSRDIFNKRGSEQKHEIADPRSTSPPNPCNATVERDLTFYNYKAFNHPDVLKEYFAF
jgi:hypothetical protein